MRIVAAATLAGMIALGAWSASPVGQEQDAIAQLSEELRARSGPGFWGDTEGPLVRDRLPGLSEAAAIEQSRWAGEFLKRVNAVKADTLAHEDWITWSLLRWEAELATAEGQFYWHEAPIAPYTSPLRTLTTGFA